MVKEGYLILVVKNKTAHKGIEIMKKKPDKKMKNKREEQFWNKGKNRQEKIRKWINVFSPFLLLMNCIRGHKTTSQGVAVKKVIIRKTFFNFVAVEKCQLYVKFKNYRKRRNSQIVKSESIQIFGRIVEGRKPKTTTQLPNNKEKNTQKKIVKKSIGFENPKVFFTGKPTTKILVKKDL